MFAVVAGIRTGALPQVGGILGALAVARCSCSSSPRGCSTSPTTSSPLVRALVVLGVVLGGVIVGEAIGSRSAAPSPTASGRASSRASTGAAGGLLGAAQAILDHLARRRAARREPAADASAARPRTRPRSRLADRFLPAPTEVVGEHRRRHRRDRAARRVRRPRAGPARARRHCPATRRRAAIAARGDPEHGPRLRAVPATRSVTGTGVVVADDYIVTNAHVVAGASTVRIEVPSGDHRRDASCCSTPSLDVALLYAPQARRAGAAVRRPHDPGAARSGRRSASRAAGRSSSCPPAVTGEYPAQRPRHLRRDRGDAATSSSCGPSVEPG